MVQVFEFESANDHATCLDSSPIDPVIAAGFKSGFVRLFDIHTLELYFETMTNNCEVKGVNFSPDSRLLATIDGDSRILILNVEKKLAIKNIDFSCPHDSYFSLAFSPDSKLLANVSTNGNMITVWETENFSLKLPPIDLTGDHLSKLSFAPNGKDLLAMTPSSKLIYLRLPERPTDPVATVKTQMGLTDMQSLDFLIAPNNQFIFCCGREGSVKVYDYFMRGMTMPSAQGF